MGRSVTVLDWTDIRSLVRICTHSFSSEIHSHSNLDAMRRRVLESFLPYFQVWQPDGIMDDELRRPLVESLETLSAALPRHGVLDRILGNASQDPILDEIRQEASRIAKLVRSAMVDEDSDAGSKPPGLITSIMVFCASQGEMIAGLNLAAEINTRFALSQV